MYATVKPGGASTCQSGGTRRGGTRRGGTRRGGTRRGGTRRGGTRRGGTRRGGGKHRRGGSKCPHHGGKKGKSKKHKKKSLFARLGL